MFSIEYAFTTIPKIIILTILIKDNFCSIQTEVYKFEMFFIL